MHPRRYSRIQDNNGRGKLARTTACDGPPIDICEEIRRVCAHARVRRPQAARRAIFAGRSTGHVLVQEGAERQQIE